MLGRHRLRNMYTPTRNCPYQMARRGSAPRGSENWRRAEVTLFSALARFSARKFAPGAIFFAPGAIFFATGAVSLRGFQRGFLGGVHISQMAPRGFCAISAPRARIRTRFSAGLVRICEFHCQLEHSWQVTLCKVSSFCGETSLWRNLFLSSSIFFCGRRNVF